jgi:methenyltetrahydrofolate cyclohydrolase
MTSPTSHPDQSATIAAWLSALATPTATPAGGAAAALAGALGAALVEMVAGLTLARERYAAVHPAAEAAREEAYRLRNEMVALATRDAAAFEAFGRALGMPSATVEERERRARARAEALRVGADVQLDLLALLADAADLGLEIAGRGLASAVGDAATAVFLAAGAARSASWAVRSNLREMGDTELSEERLGTALAILRRIEESERKVQRLLEERLA